MGFLDRLVARDRAIGATRYGGRESATASAARKRHGRYWRQVPRSARRGQAWEDRDRQIEKYGRRYGR